MNRAGPAQPRGKTGTLAAVPVCGSIRVNDRAYLSQELIFILTIQRQTCSDGSLNDVAHGSDSLSGY